MTTPEASGAERAVAAWRQLFGAYAHGVEVPAGKVTAGKLAKPHDIADVLLHVAVTFDELLTTGRLPPGRPEFAMQLLLLARDYVVPLPDDPGPKLEQDFREVLAAVRAGRDTIDRR